MYIHKVITVLCLALYNTWCIQPHLSPCETYKYWPQFILIQYFKTKNVYIVILPKSFTMKMIEKRCNEQEISVLYL